MLKRQQPECDRHTRETLNLLLHTTTLLCAVLVDSCLQAPYALPPSGRLVHVLMRNSFGGNGGGDAAAMPTRNINWPR
jgi:hypothetical protein